MSESPVDRTCTRLVASEAGAQHAAEATQLSSYRPERAYVLLGDAGSGKSTEFRQECAELGEAAVLRSARDFVTLDVAPEWRDKTLFIDGLDEIRAGSADGRPALDEIRKRLAQLGWPKYRISCREADWLGGNDRHSLESATPEGRVVVLRLDPLAEESINDLLAAELDADAIPGFLTEVDQRGLSGMLDNPLTLKMLAASMSQEAGDRPAGRVDTFELACKRMAQEHNNEHIAAAHVSPSIETVLMAAGELAAIQLLSGIEGFSLGPAVDDSAYVSLDSLVPSAPEFGGGDAGAYRHALGTKLFWASPGEDAFADYPRLALRHRQIAEFLGGRYLAHLVRSGLPARRVVALMVSPHDGRIVTSLRGLSAWFAAHCPEARDQLIDADPVGIGLYGDISSLNGDQKRRLLRTVAEYAGEGPLLGHEWRDDRSVGYRDSTAWAFRTIIDDETNEAAEELIGASPEDLASDRVREFLLQVLAVVEKDQFGAARRHLPQAASIVRDGSYSRSVRLAALDAQLHLMPAGDDRQRELRQLLDDISVGRVSDPDRQLAGSLLYALYPDDVGPDEVLAYVDHPSRERIHGLFEGFWHRGIVTSSSAKQAGRVLDALHHDAVVLVPILQARHFDSVPVDLLANTLVGQGDDVEFDRLYTWLWVAGTSEPQVLPARSPAGQCVREWLEARPSVQLRAFVEWLRSRTADDPLGFETYDRCLALHGSKLPSVFDRWCVEQATELAASEAELAAELLHAAYRRADSADGENDLTLSSLTELVSGNEQLSRILESWQEPRPLSAKQQQAEARRAELRRDQRAERLRQQQEWAEQLRSNLQQLETNTYSAVHLGQLANAYFGLYPALGRDVPGPERLAKFIGGDRDLVTAVLDAFRSSPFRSELPDVDETLALRSESQHAWLAYPVLAGLDLLHSDDPDGLDELEDEIKERTLAIHYCVPHPIDHLEPRPWHTRWLETCPELAEEVAFRCAAHALRDGEEHVPALSEIDAIDGFDELKQRLRLRILEAFPRRASIAQLGPLDRLLLGAMRHPADRGLRELIDAKLAASGMSVAQRTRWITAAALLFEGEYVPALSEHVEAHRSAVRHVAEFFHAGLGPRTSGHTGWMTSVSSGTLAVFVETLGREFVPLEPDGLITVEINAADRIRNMIHQIARLPDAGAGEALRRMENDPSLSEWHPVLRWNREQQSAIQRDAEYRQPSVREVQQALIGGVPASAAGLAALMLDRLDDVADETQGAPGDPWRPYWNEDSYGRPVTPKPEDSCRDSLLATLRERLPPEVGIEREGSYAARKRADLKASCAGFNVPIEIKRESHSDLWNAVHGQLIAQYTTDPAADGFGIYLVLWFGSEKMPIPPSGRRPGRPRELREMLEASLSIDEARKISVRVIDVSKPGRTGARRLEPRPPAR